MCNYAWMCVFAVIQLVFDQKDGSYSLYEEKETYFKGMKSDNYHFGLLAKSTNFKSYGRCFSSKVSNTLWQKGPEEMI